MMMWPLRHALAILILPVTVTVVVPVWIARSAGTQAQVPGSWIGWAVLLVGLVLLFSGVALFIGCLMLFGTAGSGTLAPWDPPANVVTRGPYAHVRNPMISGVVLALLGEGLVLRSIEHLEWAGLVFLINAVYIPLFEEPALRKRFGGEYEEYAARVPRLIPRLRPWRGRGE